MFSIIRTVCERCGKNVQMTKKITLGDHAQTLYIFVSNILLLNDNSGAVMIAVLDFHEPRKQKRSTRILISQ